MFIGLYRESACCESIAYVFTEGRCNGAPGPLLSRCFDFGEYLTVVPDEKYIYIRDTDQYLISMVQCGFVLLYLYNRESM